MTFHLLYQTPPAAADCEILYDISLDRAIKKLISDERKAADFLSVLSAPPTEPENIRYRQAIFTDFRQIPGLIDQLSKLFSRYDKIKSDWQEMRLSPIGSREGISSEALLDHACSSLKITGMFPSTIRSFFASIEETLSRYPITAPGLVTMRDYCRKMDESEALNRIVSIAASFRSLSPADYDFSVILTLDESLSTLSADLSDMTPSAPAKKEFRLFGKKDTAASAPVDCRLSGIGEDPQSNMTDILSDLLLQIDTMLYAVTDRLYLSFYGLSKEIRFYEAALIYAAEADRAGLSLTMPDILPEDADRIEAKGLADMVLFADGHGTDIVRNDILIPSGRAGMIIKGTTDSGKTVYLRTVAGAYILAQSGLPVLGDSAAFSVRSGFFSHFSSAEEAFSVGDVAGRFEQEAREIASILEKLRPHALVLFNETFQSTSYREGTESICRILQFLHPIGAAYLFVTHLTGIFDLMKNEPIIAARTSDTQEDRFRIVV